uniref:Putative ecdysone oxidase n=1 Tax=Heliconius melpomene TaxID=34740 RepID=D0ABA6_HELME|nr:putative ecdysone oxidase [Heliconius melpomene]
MEVEEVVRRAVSLQEALTIILLSISFTGYLFPRQAHVEDGYEYDFIVVGSGTSGSVIAARLTENKHFKVLVVEAGGEPPLQCITAALIPFTANSFIDWNFTSQNDAYTLKCRKDGVLRMIQGKVLGGSSCSNYMFYNRGSPQDFDQWAKISGDDTWKWENVLPYFKKSERLQDQEILRSPDGVFHGTEGYVKVSREVSNDTDGYLRSFKELGYPVIADINGDKFQGYTQTMYTVGDNYRQSAAYCFFPPAQNRPNLHLLKNSLVTKITFNKSKRVNGVQIVIDNKKEVNVRVRKEVILSAGTINSPKLLMLSGIGPKEHLKSLNIKILNNLPVGKNFQDHVVVPTLIQMEKTNIPIKPRNPNIYPFITVTGFVALNESQKFSDYEVQIYILPHDSDIPLQYFAYDFKYKRDISEIFREKRESRNVSLGLLMNLHPKSRGEVLLRSGDYKDPPLIYTGAFSEQDDIDNSVAYVKDYLRVLNTEYFKSVNATLVDLTNGRCGRFDLDSTDYWRCYSLCMMNTAFDFIGTCALGTVVDSKLRVKGVRGLRVADASVIPLGLSGNVHAPAMMIGEKVSDMIKNKYK